MVDKYSSSSKKLLSQMESISIELNVSKVGTEHLLLAFLKCDDSFYALELKKYSVNYLKVLSKVKKINVQKRTGNYIEYSEELKNTLDEAEDFSKRSDEAFVSLESIFISMIQCDNNAYDILSMFDINFDLLVKNVIKNKAKKSDLDSITDLHIMGIDKKDPLIGRENELQQLINALCRRNKPNAILVGEPGVGKTAIVEELATLVYEGKIPLLREKRVYELDIASTVSGTKYRGEFEEKLKKIIKKTKEDGNAILFIDEIHTIVKAGGAEGAIDASNILKPYLARGDIQVIGATTEEEFSLSFDKDKALKRRFQIIKVNESTCEETKNILRNIKNIYEKHYKIIINDEELDYIVDVGEKYLLNERFPDKAIDILDNSLVIANEKLERKDINNILDRFYNISLSRNDIEDKLRKKLEDSIIGQDNVIEEIINYIYTFYKQEEKRKKPLGILYFVGPSGVGKNLFAKTLGETLFEENHIFSLDLSTYGEFGGLNRLLTSSFSGDDNSPFVKFIKNKPSSLVILKSIEQSSHEIINFFNSIFDEGYFYDVKGNKVSCQNILFILISSVKDDEIVKFDCIIKNDVKNDKKRKISNSKILRKDVLKRVDEVIDFSYLSKDDIVRIIKKNYHFYQDDLSFEIGDLEINEFELKQNGARVINSKMLKKMIKKEKSY